MESFPCATIQMLHNNALISITYSSHPYYSRPPNQQQEAFNGAVEQISAFYNVIPPLPDWISPPVLTDPANHRRNYGHISSGTRGMQSGNQDEDNKGMVREWREGRRRGEWRKRGRELEEKRWCHWLLMAANQRRGEAAREPGEGVFSSHCSISSEERPQSIWHRAGDTRTFRER